VTSQKALPPIRGGDADDIRNRLNRISRDAPENRLVDEEI